jgi:hypothetical protein
MLRRGGLQQGPVYLNFNVSGKKAIEHLLRRLFENVFRRRVLDVSQISPPKREQLFH